MFRFDDAKGVTGLEAKLVETPDGAPKTANVTCEGEPDTSDTETATETVFP
jgi:hypothetical protein